MHSDGFGGTEEYEAKVPGCGDQSPLVPETGLCSRAPLGVEEGHTWCPAAPLSQPPAACSCPRNPGVARPQAERLKPESIGQGERRPAPGLTSALLLRHDGVAARGRRKNSWAWGSPVLTASKRAGSQNKNFLSARGLKEKSTGSRPLEPGKGPSGKGGSPGCFPGRVGGPHQDPVHCQPQDCHPCHKSSLLHPSPPTSFHALAKQHVTPTMPTLARHPLCSTSTENQYGGWTLPLPIQLCVPGHRTRHLHTAKDRGGAVSEQGRGRQHRTRGHLGPEPLWLSERHPRVNTAD